MCLEAGNIVESALYLPNRIKKPINNPGITISPRPSIEHVFVGKSLIEIWGINNLIGASIPRATVTITDFPPVVKWGVKNTINIS